mgnify:CR=1 FL=1
MRLSLANILPLPCSQQKILNAGWPEGQRGIVSDSESMYYLLARQVDASGGEISINI